MAVAADALVGRANELAALRDFLQAPPTSPRALVIEGEAGIGKTSLWRAGVELARERSLRVLSCRPSGPEVHLSFAGLGDLLHDGLDAVLPTLAPPQRAALEAALLLADPGDAPADHRTIGLAVLAVLRAHAASAPLAIAVDDLQWLDAPSARVLEFALRRLEREPVALLASLRTADAPPPPLDLERLFPLPPQRLTLGPLSVGALQELLRRRLGLTLPRPLLVRLHTATGGNAFYALEIGRALQRDSEAARSQAPLPVPAQLRELVQRRLGRLPARARETLLAASALSQPTVSVLTSWAGSEDRVARDLERARRAGVIELEGDRITFSHPLLASGLYDEAALPARRRIHRELARVVSEPEERARHLARAATGPDAAVVASLKEAASRARARGAPDAALELLDEALRLGSGSEPGEIGYLMLEAAEMAATTGDLARARRLLGQIVDDSPRGPLRARALTELARIIDDWEAATRLLTDARADAGEELELLIDIERALAGTIWVRAQDVEASLEHARAAANLARAAGDRRRYSSALAFLVWLEVLSVGLPVRDEFRELLADARGLTGDGFVHGPRFVWAQILHYTYDEIGAALEEFEALVAEARALGDFHALGPLLQMLALVFWRSGDWQAALRNAEEAAATDRLSGDDTALAFALSTLAVVEAGLGRTDAARAVAMEALALAARTRAGWLKPRVRNALAALELSLARPDAAADHLEQLASSAQATDYRDPNTVRWLPDHVEALVALAQTQPALELLEPFEARAASLQRRWALGTAARCRGLIVAAKGDFAGAWRAFERALEVERGVREPYELARTLLAYGVARRRAKNRRVARELLTEAIAIFEQLGAALWTERARVELTRVGTRAAAGSALTPTERRVAELVAEGHANKTVAAELFVTVKAVEANLSRVYRKLGVGSRTQLAKRLRELEDG